MKVSQIMKILFAATLSLVAVVLVFSLSGCGISSAITTLDRRAEDAIHSFDKAIAALSQESADWRVVVANLEKDISKDVQSTIRTELQDLTRMAILSAGGEFRCNEEFLRIRLRRELIHLRNSLAQSLNAELVKFPFFGYQFSLLPEEPLEPFICDVVPAGLDLSIDAERRPKIDIYGFDLRSRQISVGFRGYGLLQRIKGPVSVKDFVSTMAAMRAEMPKSAPTQPETPVKTQPETPSKIQPATTMKIQPEMLAEARLEKPKQLLHTELFNLLEPSSIILKDISSDLSIISDFHAVLDLTGSGADIPPNALDIVISWDNTIQSEIPIMTHEKVLTCETINVPFTPGVVTFIPPAVEYTEYGGGGRPDKEFNGNGPCVTFDLKLNLDPSRTILSATYTMDAWECDDDMTTIHKDYTEALGSETIILYKTTDVNETILSYDVDTETHRHYIDNDCEQDFIYVDGTSPIDHIEFTGDTDGSEAGTRTRAVITFRQINLKIQKCQYE